MMKDARDAIALGLSGPARISHIPREYERAALAEIERVEAWLAQAAHLIGCPEYSNTGWEEDRCTCGLSELLRQ